MSTTNGGVLEGDVDAEPAPKAHRGFAAMDPAKQRELAAQGGRTAHAKGTAHRFSKEEASQAGQKGGMRLVAKKGRAYMAEIGRKGGSISRRGPGGK